MGENRTRVKTLVAENAALVVAGLVLLGLVGGYLTYGAYLDKETQTEMQRVASWESTGSFTHQATVTNGTGPFAEGAVLRNRSVYFSRVTPRLNGSFTYTYTATGGGRLRANTSLALVFRSVSRDDGNETVYWRVERPLARDATTLTSGQRQRLSFSANVTAAREHAETIEKRLGETPGTVEVQVVSRVRLSGTRNGQSVDRTRRYRLPIRFERGIYRLQRDGPVSASGNRTRLTAVPVGDSPLETVGGPLLVVAAACGLLGLVGGRRAGYLTVSESERASVTYRKHRKEFDSWITVGRVPDAALDAPRVEVDTLAGLVDTAIDTNNRVVEDPDRKQFLVITEQATYVYTPPESQDAPENGLRSVTEGRSNGDEDPLQTEE